VLVTRAAVPADQRRDRNDGTRSPDDGDFDEDTVASPLRGIVDGVVDGVVSIEGDGTEVQDRRRAREDVEREPCVAPDGAERPSTLDEARNIERHHEHSDRQVGTGQRRHEEVRNRFERCVREDGQNDEHVAEDGGGDQRR